MVQVFQMSQFVANKVIRHLGGEDDKTPVEAERAPPGTAPPSCALVPHGDTRVPEFPRIIQCPHAFGYYGLCPGAHPASEERADVLRALRREAHGDLGIGERDRRPVSA